MTGWKKGDKVVKLCIYEKQARFWFYSIIGVALGLISKSGILLPLDLAISHFVQSHQPQWFITLMQFISLFKFGMLFISLPLFIFLYRQGKRHSAWLVLAASLSWFVMRFLKLTFHIPCPTVKQVQALYVFHNLSDSLHQTHPSGFLNTKVCYPSGHVFDYIVLWGTLISLREKIISNRKIQLLIKWLGLVLIATVDISRVSLGAHFTSDVVGGYLLGTSWLLILQMIFKQRLKNNSLLAKNHD